MQKGKILSLVGCMVGGCLIGFFAGKLNTAFGAILFCLGVTILVVSGIAAAKR